MRSAVAATLLAWMLSSLAFAEGKWELQYRHVDAEYDLRLLDIAFVDANRGVASGVLSSRKRDKVKPVNLVTADGKTWTVVETKKVCQDLFALPEGILYGACEDGITAPMRWARIGSARRSSPASSRSGF